MPALKAEEATPTVRLLEELPEEGSSFLLRTFSAVVIFHVEESLA